MFYYRGLAIKAHRFGYEVQYGEKPGELYVLHHCDNEKCVRKEHLYLGTQLDNMHDRWTHGRGVGMMRGENIGVSKLTEKDVLAIRSECKDSWEDFREYGKLYNVTSATIKNVVRRNNWTHI